MKNEIEKCVEKWCGYSEYYKNEKIQTLIKELKAIAIPKKEHEELREAYDIAMEEISRLRRGWIPKHTLRKKILSWAEKYGYKGISKECEDELYEILTSEEEKA